MKNAKKVLGLVIAVLMLINTFAVCSFAGGISSAVDLILTCDKESYKAGDTVTFTVSAKINSEVGDILAGNTTAIAYNSKVIGPMSDSDDISVHGMAGLLAGYDSTMSYVDFTCGGSPADENTAEGWDSAIAYAYADDTETTTTPSGTTALCTFQMKLADDVADGEYVVGFNQTAYSDDQQVGFINDAVNCGIYGQDPSWYGYLAPNQNYTFNDCTITVGEAAKPITFVKTQAQWVDGDNTQPNWNLGIVGTFNSSDIAIAFNEAGTSENVSEVGVTVDSGSYSATETTRFVYDNGDGTYSYRAVIKNIPYDVAAGTEITVTFFAMVEGAKVVGETKTIDLAEAFALAQSHNMPAFAG